MAMGSVVKKQSSPKKISTSVNIETEVASLVNLLDQSRSNDYEEWIRLGWCLHNISPDNLYVWIEFSKKSSKFVENECEKLWDLMKDEGLHKGTLHMWAKNDNPVEYKAWLNTDIFNETKNCNGSHNSIASISYKLLMALNNNHDQDHRRWPTAASYDLCH